MSISEKVKTNLRISVTEIPGTDTEYDLRVYRGKECVFPLGHESPRCDSLDAVGDVVRDLVTDEVHNAFYEVHGLMPIRTP